jgi:triosephosphate isomerase
VRTPLIAGNWKMFKTVPEGLELVEGLLAGLGDVGEADAVVVAQVRAGLAGVSAAQMAEVVIAYEPIWAIGTGDTATPDDAQAMHAAIRDTLAQLYGGEVAGATRILYGGSVKPDNADELMSQPDIDGALVGGASLKADSFLRIIQFK